MAAGVVMAVVGAAGLGVTGLSRMGAASGAAPAYEDAVDGDQLESPTTRGGLTATSRPSIEVTDTGGTPAASAAPSEAAAPAEGAGNEGGESQDAGDEGADRSLGLVSVDFNQPAAWLAVLGAGIVLLLLGLLLRSSLRPRAG
jgi:hypothetical protein